MRNRVNKLLRALFDVSGEVSVGLVLTGFGLIAAGYTVRGAILSAISYAAAVLLRVFRE